LEVLKAQSGLTISLNATLKYNEISGLIGSKMFQESWDNVWATKYGIREKG
jgi:hypothetical protein